MASSDAEKYIIKGILTEFKENNPNMVNNIQKRFDEFVSELDPEEKKTLGLVFAIWAYEQEELNEQ